MSKSPEGIMSRMLLVLISLFVLIALAEGNVILCKQTTHSHDYDEDQADNVAVRLNHEYDDDEGNTRMDALKSRIFRARLMEESDFEEAMFRAHESNFEEAQLRADESDYEEAQLRADESDYEEAQLRADESDYEEAQLRADESDLEEAQLRAEESRYEDDYK